MHRPTVTEEMILQAATIIAEKIDPENIENIAKAIAKEYSHPIDGFELSKLLDKWQNWDTTRDEMEELDGVQCEVDDLLKAAEKQWFAENDIQPPLPIGTAIAEGIIADIDSYGIAKYLVKDHGCTQEGRYRVIKFEHAVAV